MASYGSMGSYIPPPSTATAGSDSSDGSGVTHTVIVAPTQGVLRYIPFATTAAVGDSVKFLWGANEHTVTKSSELAICNKTSDSPFSSGEQNKSFTCECTNFARSARFYADHDIFRWQSPRKSTIQAPFFSTVALPDTARRACSVSSILLAPLNHPLQPHR